MRILVCSHTFSPNLGGIETVARLLAGEFVTAGNEVKICTHTPGESVDDLGLDVIRSPSRRAFREAEGCRGAWAKRQEQFGWLGSWII